MEFLVGTGSAPRTPGCVVLEFSQQYTTASQRETVAMVLDLREGKASQLAVRVLGPHCRLVTGKLGKNKAYAQGGPKINFSRAPLHPKPPCRFKKC
jgi:hypothetical protein